MENFRDALKERVLLSDGAVGTYLHEKGVDERENKSRQCIKQPDLVASIYREYVRAGADLIRTNTFDANPIKLGDDKNGLETILKTAVNLALEVREKEKKPGLFVAGSIGPLGVLLR